MKEQHFTAQGVLLFSRIKVFTGGKFFYGSLLLISKVLRQFAVTITSVRSPTYYQLAGF